MQNWLSGIKKKLRLFWPTLFIIGLVFIWYFRPFYHSGFVPTHDGGNHIARFAAYYLALREGQFPPRLGPNLLNGYSYPVFHYNYPLPNILSVPFSVFNVHFETTLQILMMLGTALGLIGVFYWLAPKVKNSPWLITLILLAFLFNPYLANAIWFRGNIGEVWAMAILPWLLAALERKNAPLLFIGTMALVLSHNVLALVGVGALLFLAIFQRRFLWTLRQIGLGLLLSAWFWLPAILEKNLVILDGASLSLDYIKHFVNFDQLLSLQLSSGYSHPGFVDGLSFGLGAIFWLTIGIFLLSLSKDKKLKKLPLLSILFLIIVFVWLQTASSRFIWEVLPLLNFVQFPWRLSAIVQILILGLAAPLLVEFKPTKWLVTISLIFTIIVNWPLQLPGYEHFERDYWLNYPGSTSTLDENKPKDFVFEYFNVRDRPRAPEVIFADASTPFEIQTQVQKWNGRQHIYNFQIVSTASASSASVPAGIVIESTAFFPGWETKVNGQRVEYIDNQDIGGRIAFVLPATFESVQVTTEFTGFTPLRLVANLLSGATLVGCAIYYLPKIFYRCKLRVHESITKPSRARKKPHPG